MRFSAVILALPALALAQTGTISGTGSLPTASSNGTIASPTPKPSGTSSGTAPAASNAGIANTGNAVGAFVLALGAMAAGQAF